MKPKVFIAHGGFPKSLAKLCDFLEALGVEPILAEVKPSEGRCVEPQVNTCIDKADCAIVFATDGHIVDKTTGKKHPRLNVADELVRCRIKFPNKTILLLQKGVELSSNESGVIYEHFTPQNMDRAFIKVAKELRAFGIIKVAGEETVENTRGIIHCW